MENLKNSFPEKSPREIRKLAKKYYVHLCDLIVEAVYQTGMGEKEIKKRVRYNNPDLIQKYFNEGKHVAGVLGHYCNWEWMCGFPLITDYKCVTIYKPLRNKVFDRLMLTMRSRFGADLVSMKMAAKKLYEYKNRGIPTITAFIADQSPPKETILYWFDFLNQETPVYHGPARLAKKMNMAVIYLKMNRIKRGYYQFDLIPLIENSAEESEYEITKAHVSQLEEHIKNQPEYWLWSHRRWKHKKEVKE